MKKIVHDKIVIGSGLNAVVYSFLNNLPLLFNHIKKPSKIDYFLNGVHLPVLNDMPNKEIKTPRGIETVGPHKLEVWNRLCFLMSLAGKIPFVDKIYSIRIDEEKKELKVTTNNSRLISIDCNQVVIFDDKNVTGLPIPIRTIQDEDKRIVLDWIDIKSGMVHEYDKIETSSPFVNCIHFYPSERIDGNHYNRKDAVAVSHLTKKQLNNIEYSDLFVRYKVLDVMKKAGIRGRRNGRDINNPGKYKHYAIKLETNKREVDFQSKNLYTDTAFIKFVYDTEESLLENINSVATHILKLYSRLRGTI